jgi:hypothetical protein
VVKFLIDEKDEMSTSNGQEIAGLQRIATGNGEPSSGIRNKKREQVEEDALAQLTAQMHDVLVREELLEVKGILSTGTCWKFYSLKTGMLRQTHLLTLCRNLFYLLMGKCH